MSVCSSLWSMVNKKRKIQLMDNILVVLEFCLCEKGKIARRTHKFKFLCIIRVLYKRNYSTFKVCKKSSRFLKFHNVLCCQHSGGLNTRFFLEIFGLHETNTNSLNRIFPPWFLLDITREMEKVWSCDTTDFYSKIV